MLSRICGGHGVRLLARDARQFHQNFNSRINKSESNIAAHTRTPAALIKHCVAARQPQLENNWSKSLILIFTSNRQKGGSRACTGGVIALCGVIEFLCQPYWWKRHIYNLAALPRKSNAIVFIIGKWWKIKSKVLTLRSCQRVPSSAAIGFFALLKLETFCAIKCLANIVNVK